MGLDLGAQRSAGELVGLAFALFRAHAATLFPMTLVLVAPVVIGVDGIWARALADGPRAEGPQAAVLTGVGLQGLIVTPVVLALHTAYLQALARGEAPHARDALRAAAPRLGAVLVAALLAGLVIVAGTLLLIVPGVYAAVRLYVTAPAIVDGAGSPGDGMRASWELVGGEWWQTFGRLLLAGLAIALVAIVGQALAVLPGSGPLYVSVLAITQAVAASLAALFGALLYFDLRARKETHAA